MGVMPYIKSYLGLKLWVRWSLKNILSVSQCKRTGKRSSQISHEERPKNHAAECRIPTTHLNSPFRQVIQAVDGGAIPVGEKLGNKWEEIPMCIFMSMELFMPKINRSLIVNSSKLKQPFIAVHNFFAYTLHGWSAIKRRHTRTLIYSYLNQPCDPGLYNKDESIL